MLYSWTCNLSRVPLTVDTVPLNAQTTVKPWLFGQPSDMADAIDM